MITLVFRTLTTSLMHGMVTAAFGLGLMLIQKIKGIRIPIVFGLFAACASTHALFNLFLQTNLAFISVVMPVVMFISGWIIVRNMEDEQ